MIEGPPSIERLVVLDDDPTGVQTLEGIRVLLDWDPERIARALAGRRSVHLITNSRALSRVQCRSDRRIGFPASVVRARGRTRSDASKVVPMRCDHPASSRLTRPGTALPSQM